MHAKLALRGNRHADIIAIGIRHLSGELQGVVGIARDKKPQGNAAHLSCWASPVGGEPLDKAGVRQDVDENILAAVGDRLVPVMVHILEIPGRQRGRNDEGWRGLDLQRRELICESCRAFRFRPSWRAIPGGRCDVLEHAEPHTRDLFVAGVPCVPRGDEPAAAQRGFLRA